MADVVMQDDRKPRDWFTLSEHLLIHLFTGETLATIWKGASVFYILFFQHYIY